MAFPFVKLGFGLSALKSGFKLFGAGKEKKQALQDIENFDRQDLDNAFTDLPISTVGSDLIREESALTTASLVDLARSGGVRSVLAGLPKIQQLSNDANRQAALDLDNQIQDKNRLIAEDEVRIRGIQEQRDRDNLAGLGAKLDNANQNLDNGLSELINTGFAAGNILGNRSGNDPSGAFRFNMPKFRDPFAGLDFSSPMNGSFLFKDFQPKPGSI